MKKKRLRTCCRIFRLAWRERHVQGSLMILVLPSQSGALPGPSFQFATRPIRKTPEWNFMVTCFIDFCPWCGVRLKDFYRDNWRDFLDAEINKEFKIAGDGP